MLYLAEVQKEKVFVGNPKTKVKLLACQRSEQNWTAVPNEEVIQADEAGKFNEGALVLVDLSTSKQVQRVQEAGRPLVSTLQNFSRLQEKFKTQEEEIEQWKQSLTYQSQELNRREMEMEARREQLQEMEDDFEKLEQQRQEIESLREEINRQREELERRKQDLEGAWEHLNGERRRFDELKGELQGKPVLDEEQARRIQEMLDRLSGSVVPIDSIREQLNLGLEVINGQQNVLNEYWQQLEQQRNTAQQAQEEVDRQASTISNRWQDWHQAQTTLEQARSELKAQQAVLSGKQEYLQFLESQRHSQEELYQQICRLAEGNSGIKLGIKVDLEALEKMPLEELETKVQELQQDFEKLSSFVNEQEEELTSKAQTIDELQARMQQVSEYDRLSLENDLADERDGYRFLEETLEGQRRTLRQKEEELGLHRSLLMSRKGQGEGSGSEPVIDLGPVVSQIEAQRQQQGEEINKLEAQIEQMRTAIQQAQSLVDQQTGQQEQLRNEIKQQEEALRAQQRSTFESVGRVNTYQETLQPIQDHVNGLRQRLDAIAGTLSQVQEAGDYQLQAITEMRQILQGLLSVPEFAS